jgi:uncharacterized protein YjbI with pentapeptide repeats
MANAEHLEILKSGVEVWNQWRFGEGKYYLDLVDLNGADLSGADLSNANLSNADLSNADLSGSDLSGTDLTGANLSRANLRRADLSGLEQRSIATLEELLSGIFQFEADLSGANLSEANLRGANLSGVNLSSANLREARLVETNLGGVDLSGANLIKANLIGVNLRGANLSRANLSEANLGHTNLTESILDKTLFFETILSQTIFGLTDLSTCKSLESVQVSGECVIDFATLRASKNLPKAFLTKMGIPDQLVEYLPDFYNPALMIYPAFLSHSWSDKPFVRKLYDALAEKGVTTWLDEKKLKPGDNIHDSISEGIKYYDKLILVCSENSLNSWWVEKELEKVYEKEREMQKEREKKFRLVIPIRIDDSIFQRKEGILTTVRNSVIGDFTQWQDDAAFEKAVKELVDALNANRVDVRPPSFF